MKISPLHNLFADFGSTFGERDGWEVALLAGRSQEDEYRTIRTGAALLDRTPLGKLRLTGSDRLTWLQGMVSNDLNRPGPEFTSIDCFILDATGHVISDCQVTCYPDSLILLLPISQVDVIYERLQGFLILEDVEITEQSEYLSAINLQGPRASEVLSKYSPGANEVHFSHNRTGSGGVDIIAPKSEIEAIARKLVDLGAQPAGERAFQAARIESGIPQFGTDFGPSTLAPEIGIESTHISYTKGCYVGQEIVARIQSRGHTNRFLTGFLIDGDRPPELSAKLTLTDDPSNEIGWITSAKMMACSKGTI
ncbi:MAG: hypothetical protein ABJA67_09740, partial [Chthonomonadales bacterium]